MPRLESNRMRAGQHERVTESLPPTGGSLPSLPLLGEVANGVSQRGFETLQSRFARQLPYEGSQGKGVTFDISPMRGDENKPRDSSPSALNDAFAYGAAPRHSEKRGRKKYARNFRRISRGDGSIGAARCFGSTLLTLYSFRSQHDAATYGLRLR